MTGERIISELPAKPEIHKEDSIRLMAFLVEREGKFQLPVISSRPLTFPDRPPRGITIPLQTMANIIALEESLAEASLFGDVVCYIDHAYNSFNKVTWLTGVPAQGLQSQVRKYLQWLFTRNAMYELVYLGRVADRHKIILVKSKIYMAILRKSFHSIV